MIVIVGGAMWTLYKAYHALLSKINGVGVRTTSTEQAVTVLQTQMAAQLRETDIQRSAQAEINNRLARVEKGVDGTNEHITEMKLEIMGALGEIKTGALQEEAKVRERLVRLETVSELEQKLGRPLRELMDGK